VGLRQLALELLMRTFVLPLLALPLFAACAASPPAPAPAAAAEVSALGFVDMAGRAHTVAEDLATGRKVVLVFWETWCESCREESGELGAVARAHPELAFYGVVPGPDGTVDDALVLDTARAWFLPYPQVRDRDLTLTRAFAVEGTPTVVVIGAGGEVLYKAHELPADWGAL
jgi:thiol-disulfide isomerase/thioredoxin